MTKAKASASAGKGVPVENRELSFGSSIQHSVADQTEASLCVASVSWSCQVIFLFSLPHPVTKAGPCMLSFPPGLSNLHSARFSVSVLHPQAAGFALWWVSLDFSSLLF